MSVFSNATMFMKVLMYKQYSESFEAIQFIKNYIRLLQKYIF